MVNWPQISIDPDRGYNMCFGCGPDNPVGLKLDFKWDGKTARAELVPCDIYQGWNGFLHGGIMACILDEALVYAAYHSGVISITARMQVRLRQMVPITESLIITSSVIKASKRLVETEAKISLKDGTVIADGTSTQFVIRTREDGSGRAKS